MATVPEETPAATTLTDTTVQLSADTLSFLRQAAQKRGVSTGDMVRIALGTQKFLSEAVDNGSKVQLRSKDGTLDVSI